MNCSECSAEFTYFLGEEDSYRRFDAKLPEICPECRHKRHLIFRNERKLFLTKSHISGKTIISTYPSSSPFKIIDTDEWWSDSFDASHYGKDFDFTKSFFEQFRELQKEVPRWARMYINCENSDYTNNSAEIKDSYLTFSSYDSENLYYCMRVMKCNTCIDCLNVKESEYCSECVECKKCYNTHYSQLSDGCRDSYFLYDCRGCTNCFLCAQIRNKEYMILNKQYSKEDYSKEKEKFLYQLFNNKNALNNKFENFKKQLFHKNLRVINSDNCTGDFIGDSKNIMNGFYVTESEDCINVYDCYRDKNCYDNLANEKSELCLECDTAYELYNVKFSSYTVTARDAVYCDQCVNITNCFGCVGLRKAEFMILNKKYSKEDYETMLTKIKEHMEKTGEWGRPFPSTLSSFPYNITAAHEYYPLSKEQAIAKGYLWHDEEKKLKPDTVYEIPKNIEEVDESICKQILTCENTGKGYKIIPQELKFYKTYKLPIPRISPDERYKKLLSLQPPKKLISSTCSCCAENIKTVYPENSGYKVLCEKCYLEKVY
ncbi:hypothetical protein HZA38_01650 [Candidatus Peregrinibacteria bacterium]|nr:hypothetical protein [Candidatus Peregrinibacteria bacterium]